MSEMDMQQIADLIPHEAVAAALPDGTLAEWLNMKHAIARAIVAWSDAYTVPLNRTPTDIVLPVNRTAQTEAAE